jgi:dihydroorotate dehydrogenase
MVLTRKAFLRQKKRLEKYQRTNGRVLGVNLGKNKLSESNTGDYVQGIQELAPYADYVVINISSPNTPNLRKLQDKSPLEELLSTAVTQISQIKQDNGKVPPLFIKIAPDCTDEQLKDIADLTLKYNIDALIVSNTTIQTSKLLPEYTHITGGLSGRPLKDLSTATLKKMYQLTGGKVTLVGCGGVSSGQDAYEKIRNGASLVQLYTAMSLQGVGIARRIQKELAQLLKKDGYTNVREAVGIDVKLNK